MKINQIEFTTKDIFESLKSFWTSEFGSTQNPFNNESNLWYFFVDLYGEREMFSKIQNMIESGFLLPSKCDLIAGSLMMRYRYTWKHLYDLYFKEYDPIENYNRNETTTDQTTSNGSGQSTSTTKTRPYDTLDETFVNNGQNTSNATNSNNTIFTHQNITKGNIGVTTTQQMMTQEEVFWANYNVYDMIFKDIANYIGKGVI